MQSINNQSMSQASIPYQQEKVDIFLKGKNLPKTCYVKLIDMLTDIEIDKTELRKSKRGNPKFLKNFKIDYLFSIKQEFKLQIFKENHPNPCGEVQFLLSDLIRAKNKTKAYSVISQEIESGKLVLTVETACECEDEIIMQFSGSIPQTGYCFFKSVPQTYLRVNRSMENGRYIRIFKTKPSKTSSWEKIKLKLSKLCRNDMHRTIKIDIIKAKNHSVLSSFEFNLNNILEEGRKDFSMKSQIGRIDVRLKNVQIIKIPSFVDFIMGGIEICFVGAIDFTSSNGHPDKKGSLHYSSNENQSPYEKALINVGEILLSYDTDKLVPLLGFGAEVNRKMSHCFPLNQQDDPNVYNIEGMVNAYRNTLNYCKFAGPTFFAPLLKWTTNFIKKELRESENLQYYILLILTDGKNHDMKQTIDNIVEQSGSLPLSIIIVGVGDGPFDNMDYLDADDERLVDSQGNEQKIDNVQFVEFSKFGNSASLLTREVLMEVPTQVQEFYSLKKIMPYDKNPEFIPQQQQNYMGNILSDAQTQSKANSFERGLQKPMTKIPMQQHYPKLKQMQELKVNPKVVDTARINKQIHNKRVKPVFNYLQQKSGQYPPITL